MKKLNPAYVEAIRKTVSASPFFRHLSMCIRELNRGVAVVDLEVQAEHLQAFGYVHGGVYAAVIDTAAFWSAFGELEEGTGITTVELKVNYLAPVQAGRLTATGRRIKLGKTLGLAEATVNDARGRVVAHGTSTLIVLPGFGLAGGPALPPKFL
ncbi:MAG TPA: PaaI family thioesterase [Syntrophales bacterium]|nr:PaaI family thioesterase [Syntrophales bacterium]HOU78077.1 PaaI family thioesterase [Syntrophales bacterium]HPC32759.1 PaaI family thioesterase [Syntrophales bacterium]HQG34696.1 PaaI family thioesterase [Syntrophales bacterium]HQI36076.1 PaaI family thioesterase [Syntrophales bacterium]